jgi:hypothetical protein
MRTKAIIGAIVVLVVITGALSSASRVEDPIRLHGDLSKAEIASI